MSGTVSAYVCTIHGPKGAVLCDGHEPHVATCLNQIKNSGPQSHSPPFRWSVAAGGYVGTEHCRLSAKSRGTV